MTSRASDALPPVEVREKYPEETRDLLALARALGGPFDAAALRRMKQDLAEHTGLVAECRDEPLGFVTWAPSEAAGVIELTWLAVSAAHQRQGLATRLCDAMEERLKSRAARSVETSVLASYSVLPAVARARRFFLARGYREVRVDVGHWGPEKDRLLLRKALGTATKPRAKPGGSPRG